MRDAVTKLRRLSLVGRKPRISPVIAIYITIDPTYDDVMFKSQNIGHNHLVYEDTVSDLIHCYHIIM